MLCRVAMLTAPDYRARTTHDRYRDGSTASEPLRTGITEPRGNRSPRRGQASLGIASPSDQGILIAQAPTGARRQGSHFVIFIVVKFTIRPDKADQWLSLVDDFTQATRAEPGNIFFEWSRSVDVPNQFVVVEAFADGAGEAHVNSDHFKTAMAWMPEAIARKPEIINVHVPQDGWGEMGELTPVNSH